MREGGKEASEQEKKKGNDIGPEYDVMMAVSTDGTCPVGAHCILVSRLQSFPSIFCLSGRKGSAASMG